MLALQLDVEEHLFLDLFKDLFLGGAFASLLFGIVHNVGERSGVDIEGLDIDEDFVVVEDVHIVVEFVGRLGQYALGLEYTVNTVFVTFWLHKINLLV